MVLTFQASCVCGGSTDNKNYDCERCMMLGELLDVARALEESVKLQSHYASLLNTYDGGQRMQFSTADEWIKRLRQCGTLSP